MDSPRMQTPLSSPLPSRSSLTSTSLRWADSVSSQTSVHSTESAPSIRTKTQMAALFAAMQNGRFHEAQRMLAQLPMGTINLPQDAYGTTLLIDVASRMTQPDHAIHMLLDAGADPSLTDDFGANALMVALARRNISRGAITTLVCSGIHLRQTNFSGQTALHLLLAQQRSGMCQMVRMMVRLEPTLLFQADQSGLYPIHLAARQSDAALTLAQMVTVCTPDERTTLLNAQSATPQHNLGNAAVAALLFNPCDEATDKALVFLSALGVCLSAAELTAHLYEGLHPKAVRMGQAITVRAHAARAQALLQCDSVHHAGQPIDSAAPANPLPSLPKPRTQTGVQVRFADGVSWLEPNRVPPPRPKRSAKRMLACQTPPKSLSIAEELAQLEEDLSD